MSDIKDWTIEMCVEWLEDPYNEPCRETDDSFDRAYRSEVKKRLRKLLNELHNTEGEEAVRNKCKSLTPTDRTT